MVLGPVSLTSNYPKGWANGRCSLKSLSSLDIVNPPALGFDLGAPSFSPAIAPGVAFGLFFQFFFSIHNFM